MKDPIFYRQFGYDLGKLPNAQLARLETGVASIAQARERTGASIGYPGWPLIYYLVMCSVDPARSSTVLETGTNHGCSTIALAQALVDAPGGGQVHTIEIDAEVADIARQNVQAAGLADCVQIHVGSTRDLLGPLAESLPAIDLAFLDGSHAEADVLFEFEAVVERMSPGSLVVFDNTYPIADDGEDQRVYGALHTISARYGGNLINLPFVSWYTPGLAVWQKEPFAPV